VPEPRELLEQSFVGSVEKQFEKVYEFLLDVMVKQAEVGD
jgi:hypothetical protein